MSVNPRKTQAEIMVAARLRDPERLHAAKRDHAAAMLEQYITRIVASAPTLSLAQRDRLAALLRPAGMPGDAPTPEERPAVVLADPPRMPKQGNRATVRPAGGGSK